MKTAETINLPFVPNGNQMVLGVPTFRHIKVYLKHEIHQTKGNWL